MAKPLNLLLGEMFNVDFEQEPLQIIKDLESEITAEKEVKFAVNKDETNQKILISYDLDPKEDKLTALSTAAGLPNEKFAQAEKIYNSQVKKYGLDYEYNLVGHLIGGALAQYAGIMSETSGTYYQVNTYNGLGIENFLRFKGNEFLGYKLGLLHYLYEILYDDKSRKKIFYNLNNKGVLKRETIAKEFREEGNKLRVKKFKQIIKETVAEELKLTKSEADDLVEEHFNRQLIERKMRFIDRHQNYKKQVGSLKENIFNYIMSYNLVGRIFGQIGTTLLVDKEFSGRDDELEKLFDLAKKANKEAVKELIASDFSLFVPFFLTREGGNGAAVINKFGAKPKIGEITSGLSRDYLSALVKDIFLDLKEKNEDLIKDILKDCRKKSGRETAKLFRDRMRHSLKLKGLLPESEVTYKSSFIEENPDLFTAEDKIYTLDKVVLNHLKEMHVLDISKLWDWKLSGDGIFMLLGTNEPEEVIKYHDDLDTELEELELKLTEPSKNTVTGTLRQPPNYKDVLDTEYRHLEDEAYNFNSDQGVGFSLFTKQMDPGRKLKVDGSSIAGTYRQIDQEEAEIGGRKKTLRDDYFGDNIILKRSRRFDGKLAGDLVYLYGPNKENELKIHGFVNGDYGIKLEPKAKSQKEEEKSYLTYTPHQIRIEPFEFQVLKELEINKSFDHHTRVKIKGQIDSDLKDEYRRKLLGGRTEIKIVHSDDDCKVLFKGYIEDYQLQVKNRNHYLSLKAVSYSKDLDLEPRTRIFQNQGTTYQEVFDLLAKEYDLDFSIAFNDVSLEDEVLVDKERPVVLQYQETDWEFLKRICSYLNQIIIIDDTKGKDEAITVLLGFHAASARDLNNISGVKKTKTTSRGDKHIYYKVDGYKHSLSRELFDLGRPVNYVLNNKEEGTKELAVIKNRIFLKQSVICSDFTLVDKEMINLPYRRRKIPHEGVEFTAEVKDVNEEYKAQVEFCSLENEYNKDKSFWFPIKKLYSGAYFAPEIGDIVEVRFSNQDKEQAVVVNSTVKEGEANPPHLKRFFLEDREIRLDREAEEVRITGKEKEIYIKLSAQGIVLVNGDQKMVLKKDEISMSNDTNSAALDESKVKVKGEAGEMTMSDSEVKLGLGSREVKVDSKKIDFK